MTDYFGGRPCREIIQDDDGFTVRCMVTAGIEHSHSDYTARESVPMGNEVIDGRGILFDADGYEIDPPEPWLTNPSLR